MSSSFTTSICRIAPMSGTHRVKILGHSLIRDLTSHGTIHCGTFSLGGYQWDILYDPCNTDISGRTYISFFLKLLSEAQKVVVFLCLSLVDQSGVASQTDSRSGPFTYTKKGDVKGFYLFKERSVLNSLNYVKDDNFMIQCDLHIIKPSVQMEHSISVPPSDLSQHLDQLLLSGKGVDVFFKVKGETFPAHRNILSARSSVFRAELFGSMRESKDTYIEIEDMEPEVFKALLHFIYTDTLGLSNEQSDQDADEEILTQHLLVASDRYGLERLRLICEEKLARNISSDNVVTTLMLAARHNCKNLEKICVDYMSSAENPHSLIETCVSAFNRQLSVD